MTRLQDPYQALEELTGYAGNSFQELELTYKVVTTERWFSKDTRSITTARE